MFPSVFKTPLTTLYCREMAEIDGSYGEEEEDFGSRSFRAYLPELGASVNCVARVRQMMRELQQRALKKNTATDTYQCKSLRHLLVRLSVRSTRCEKEWRANRERE
jgi:hypothetical protein